MRKALLCTGVLALVLAGCRTTSVGPLAAIDIPPGLTTRDVQTALIVAVATDPARPGANWERIVDSALAARLVYYRSPLKRATLWFVEAVEPDAVVYGYSRRGHYLRVRMALQDTRLVPTIVGSRNLKESGGNIHKAALEWIGELEVAVRATLGGVSAAKSSALSPS